MWSLRIAGIILGILGIILTCYLRFRLRRLRNIDWLTGNFLFLCLILLGLYPDLFNVILGFFAFRKGGYERIIGLLVISNFILFFLIYGFISRTTYQEELIDRLVRELAKKEYLQKHKSDGDPIYIIIPAYNEAENIASVLTQIPTSIYGLKTRILVVIDGATDHTEAVVKGLNQEYISYLLNRGGGSALKAGYELALAARAEIIVTLDADGQHLPEEIPRLIKPIIDGEADLVNGSRVMGHYEVDHRLRAWGIKLFNWLVSALTWTRITDSSNSFRAIRAATLSQLNLQQLQFHTAELLIETLKKGFKVKEVPITIKKRLQGESKKPPTLSYGWGYIKAIMSTWLR